jgi:hypothetical protein
MIQPANLFKTCRKLRKLQKSIEKMVLTMQTPTTPQTTPASCLCLHYFQIFRIYICSDADIGVDHKTKDRCTLTMTVLKNG